ncbi:MAG: nitroreductase family protein [Candidatus Sumerlaeia bacterium]|nr:nitroreductase family protein [Candidatus Sumerlaeia bacterium]
MMDVMQAIRIRRSVRSYQETPIPTDLLDRLLDALRLAPSACNYQPWRFIVVTNRETRTRLAAACRNQNFIAQAPVIIVGCGFPAKAYQRMGGSGNSVDIDVAIAFDHLMLAAAEAGLGTCWIGAFEEKAVKEILGVPDEAKVVALTPLGYPTEPGLLHPVEENRRLARTQVIAFERF